MYAVADGGHEISWEREFWLQLAEEPQLKWHQKTLCVGGDNEVQEDNGKCLGS